MTTVVKLLMEVGIPIGSAIVMGFFIFLTLKYILDGVAGSVQGLTNIMQGLESRVRQMNNDMIKIDLIVSEALEFLADVVCPGWAFSASAPVPDTEGWRWLPY